MRAVRVVVWLLLIALPAVAFWPGLSAPFVFDDFRNVAENPAVAECTLAPSALWRAAVESPLPTRPLAYVSFGLNVATGGLTALHVTNLVIHVLATLALFLLARRWLARHHEETATTLLAAAGATLVWSLAPVHVQAVTYVVQRMTSLATLGILVALLGIWHTTSTATRTRAALVAVLGGGLVALLTKELTVLLPSLALLLQWLREARGRRWPSPRASLGALGATLLVALFYAALRGGVGVVDSAQSYVRLPVIERLWTFPRIVWHYVSLVLWPHPSRFSIDPELIASSGPLSPATTLPALLALVGLVVLALVTRRRWPSLTLGVLWFVGALIPEHTFLQLDLVFQHHLYLPTVGLAIALAALLRQGLDTRPTGRVVTGVLLAAAIVASFTVTWQRNVAWQDPVRLWREATERSTTLWRPPLNLARGLRTRGDAAGAESAYREVMARAPWFRAPVSELSGLLIETGRVGAAETLLRDALPAVESPDLTAVDLANVQMLRGDVTGARTTLEAAVERTPTSAEAWRFLGVVQARLGNAAGARTALRRSLDIDPDHADARRLLSSLDRGTAPDQ